MSDADVPPVKTDVPPEEPVESDFVPPADEASDDDKPQE